MGIIYRDPEDSYYDEAEFAIVKGNTVFGNLMDDVRFYGELALVREGIEKIHEALPDYKYVPMRHLQSAALHSVLLPSIYLLWYHVPRGAFFIIRKDLS